MKKLLLGVTALVLAAGALYSADRDDAVLKKLRDRLSSDPADIRATAELARLLEKKGGYTDAAKLWERAIRLQPDESGHYASLARCCNKLERPDKARDICTNALVWFERSEDLLRAAGSAEFRLGNNSNALGYFRRAFDASDEKGKAWVLVQIGKCRRELKDLPGSREDLLAAIHLRDDPWAYFEYGKTLEAMGFDSDALWAYERSRAFAVREDADAKAAINNRYAGSLYRCASALRDQGKKADAKKQFEVILSDRELSRTKWGEKAAFWIKRL